MVSPKRKEVLFRMFMMVFNFNQLLFYRTVRDHRHKAAIYLYSIPFTTFPLFPICTEMWVIKFEFDTPHIVNWSKLQNWEPKMNFI